MHDARFYRLAVTCLLIPIILALTVATQSLVPGDLPRPTAKPPFVSGELVNQPPCEDEFATPTQELCASYEHHMLSRGLIEAEDGSFVAPTFYAP